jgi:hypothetical protein
MGGCWNRPPSWSEGWVIRFWGEASGGKGKQELTIDRGTWINNPNSSMNISDQRVGRAGLETAEIKHLC